MIYTERDKLTVVETEKEIDHLDFDRITEALLERPSNMIYCESEGRLYGIVSMGDVMRACKDGLREAAVNRRFTKLSPGESMRAREIFRERETINALPVVGEGGGLLGDYTRWDNFAEPDDWTLRYGADFWDKRFWPAEPLLLVKPCGLFSWKTEKYAEWIKQLERHGIDYQTVERRDIKDCDEYVRLFFVDEDERRGMETLYLWIQKKRYTAFYSYSMFADNEVIKYMRDSYGVAETGGFLKRLQNIGVHSLILEAADYGGAYGKTLRQQIKKRGARWGHLPESAYDGFFDGMYTQADRKEIANIPVDQIHMKPAEGFLVLEDAESTYYHTKDGERLTVGQPEEYERTVWFYGPCLVIGFYAEDQYTMESFLQARLNESGSKVRVVNLGVTDNTLGMLNHISHTELKTGDVVVVYLPDAGDLEMERVNLYDAAERSGAPAEWFVDSIMHCNHRANEMFADAVCEKLASILSEPPRERAEISADDNFLVDAWLKQHFSDFHPAKHEKVGAIVMNCNPFTYGHRYLIEYASARVDRLIVFVVEEDKSLFSFGERFAMVRDGAADLANVRVVPSGDFILSQRTFPEYFLKIEDEDIVRNVEYDITLFAERIAPALHIASRFVGEEPEDAVTDEYNSAMKRILPAHGIDIVEVPRRKADGNYISATTVRKCLEANDLPALDALVPETTKRILFRKNE